MKVATGNSTKQLIYLDTLIDLKVQVSDYSFEPQRKWAQLSGIVPMLPLIFHLLLTTVFCVYVGCGGVYVCM